MNTGPDQWSALNWLLVLDIVPSRTYKFEKNLNIGFYVLELDMSIMYPFF